MGDEEMHEDGEAPTKMEDFPDDLNVHTTDAGGEVAMSLEETNRRATATPRRRARGPRPTALRRSSQARSRPPRARLPFTAWTLRRPSQRAAFLAAGSSSSARAQSRLTETFKNETQLPLSKREKHTHPLPPRSAFANTERVLYVAVSTLF